MGNPCKNRNMNEIISEMKLKSKNENYFKLKKFEVVRFRD